MSVVVVSNQQTFTGNPTTFYCFFKLSIIGLAIFSFDYRIQDGDIVFFWNEKNH